MSDTRALNEHALTEAHAAVERVLIALRDDRISVMGPANGFIVREKDGRDSPIMRIGTRDGLRIAITAYLDAASVPAGEGAQTQEGAP